MSKKLKSTAWPQIMTRTFRLALVLLGLAMAASASSPSFSNCDINQDGSTNSQDVVAILNEALGVSTAVHDLNGDGVVNVLDVQIVINAAAGLGCAADTGTPPVITDFSPKSGSIGTTVTVTGSNFGPSLAINMPKQGGGTITEPISTLASGSVSFVLGAGTSTGPISLSNGGAGTSTATNFTVTASHTFTLGASPGTANLIQGQSVTYSVTLNSSDGFSELANLNVSGVPTGVTSSLKPAAITAGQTSVLTLTAPSNQTVGTSNLTVSASSTVDGLPVNGAAPVSLSVVGPTTSFLGRTVVSDTLETPLAGVNVSTMGFDGAGNTTGCTGHTIVSDASGNFALTNLPSSCIGPQLVRFDGTTATSPAGKYAGVDLVFTLVSGQVVVSPVLVHLPRIDVSETFNVQQNSSVDQTYTFTSIPGLSVTVYAGTVFTNFDGTQPNPFPLTAIQVPVDRLPDQMPLTNSMVSAFIVAFQPANTTASKAVAVWFPNTLNTAPGTDVPLMTLDPTRGRMVAYGTGTVSNDGTTIIPDVDPSTGSLQHRYGIVHFDWHGPAPPGPPTNPAGGGGGPGAGGNVDLGSGLEVYSHTDIGFRGNRGDLRIIRTYRTLSNETGPFGLGGNHNYNIRLSSVTPQTQATLNLIMPDGNRIPFARQANGVLTNTTIPRVAGAVMVTNADGTSSITFKDGTIFGFKPGTFPIGSVLISITDPNGNVTTIARNQNDPIQITSITDPVGRQLQFTYDGSDRITKITDPIGRSTSYTYDSSSNLTSFTDPNGAAWGYQYDNQNRLTQVTDPRGIVAYHNTYDNNGRVSQQTQADGGTLQFAYVLTNTLVPNSPVVQTTVTNQLGLQTVYRFNTVGFVVAVTDPNGQTRQFARDPGTNMITAMTGAGVCRECGDPASGNLAFTYDQNGNQATQTDALGNTWSNTFDPNTNQILTRTDPLGDQSKFSYDGRGNLTSLKDQRGNAFAYTWDGHGLLLTSTDPAGGVVKNTYDASGNLVTVTDQFGNVTRFQYDAISRLVQTQDAAGNTQAMTYDGADRINSVSDGAGRTVRFAFDALGGLLSVTDNANHASTFTHDNLDRISTRKDPLNRTLTFGYDSLGRLTSQNDRLGHVQTFTYDSVNRVTQETYTDSTVKRTYDANSRLVQVDDSASGTFTFTYDAAGRLLKAVTPVGSVTFTRDKLGRMATRQVAGQAVESFTYDAASNLTAASMPQASVQMTYDVRNLRTVVTRSNGVNTSFVYDAAGRVSSKTTAKGATTLNTQTYAYDVLGRRSSISNSLAQPLGTQAAPGGTYDAANELTALGSTTYTNDANGNRLTASNTNGTTSYSWDARGRLASLTTADGRTISLVYDPAGNLIRYRVQGGGTDVTKTFVLDGFANIAYQGSTDTTQQFSMLTGSGVDEYFAAVDSGGGPHYGVLGNLGSAIANTGAAGTIDGTASYEPFGQTTASNTAYPIGYSGQIQVYPGLQYFRSRFYDPLAGRYLSEDTIGFLGGWNLYMFNQNDPINHADPEGTWTGIDDGIAILGGGIAGVIGQGIGDLITGSSPHWEDYAGAFVGGAAAGETLLYTGNPVLAGAAGGAAGNLTKQGLKNLTGEQCGFDWGSLAYDTGTGAAIGWLVPGNEIPGVTSGRNSWQAVAKTASTKLENGTIDNISGQTYAKALGANLGGAIDATGAAGAAGGVGNVAFPTPGCKGSK